MVGAAENIKLPILSESMRMWKAQLTANNESLNSEVAIKRAIFQVISFHHCCL